MKALNHNGVKKPSDLPRFLVNSHGKKGARMNYMLAKCSNPNWKFYHPPATEIDPWYAEAVCCMIAPVLDHIIEQGVSDIQMAGKNVETSDSIS